MAYARSLPQSLLFRLDLHIHPCHFCKISFPPDKFCLFFFWQTFEHLFIEYIIYAHFLCGAAQLCIQPLLSLYSYVLFLIIKCTIHSLFLLSKLFLLPMQQPKPWHRLLYGLIEDISQHNAYTKCTSYYRQILNYPYLLPVPDSF